MGSCYIILCFIYACTNYLMLHLQKNSLLISKFKNVNSMLCYLILQGKKGMGELVLGGTYRHGIQHEGITYTQTRISDQNRVK